MLLVPRGELHPPVPPGHARIAVVHSRRLYLAALAELLTAPPLEAAVSSFTRSDEALESVRDGCYDVLLCGLRCEPLSGVEIARRIREEGGPPVGLIADAEDAERALDALQTADGVFTADISHEEFAAGVDAIMRGHYVMSATLANRTLERRSQPFEGSPASSAYRRLSATEREILLALGTAIPIESIAASRGITKKTVRNHVASIYHKLRLQSRAEAILWVARMGLSDDMHGDPAKVEAASA